MEDKKKQTHIPYAAVTGLALIVIQVVLQIAHHTYHPALKYLIYIAFFVGILLNAIAFSKANDADITFGQAFTSCFKATAIVGLISFLWAFIMPMLFPGMYEEALEQARIEMEKAGTLSDEQIEMGLNFSKTFMKAPVLQFLSLVMIVIVGLFFSLIAAAIAKKNPRPQQQFDLR